jgi:hypothetical protein
MNSFVREAILFQTTRLLAERPTQAAYMGLAVARWAYVEQAMAFFYDYLLAQRDEPRKYGWPVDGLGVASFGAVRSIRSKIDLLTLAIEWRLGEAFVEEFQATVLKKIEAASRVRNVIAHGLVEVRDEAPVSLVFELSGKEFVYSDSDFLAALEKIADAHEAVVWFHNKRAREMLQSGAE